MSNKNDIAIVKVRKGACLFEGTMGASWGAGQMGCAERRASQLAKAQPDYDFVIVTAQTLYRKKDPDDEYVREVA